MEDINKLKCPRCGTILERNVSFNGADWNSMGGAGSGFDFSINLECPKKGCGRIFTIGRIRNEGDICEEKPYLRPYNDAGTYRRCAGR